VRLKLTVVDTPGFGDLINNDKRCVRASLVSLSLSVCVCVCLCLSVCACVKTDHYFLCPCVYACIGTVTRLCSLNRGICMYVLYRISVCVLVSLSLSLSLWPWWAQLGDDCAVYPGPVPCVQ
jgi:hypothetical protein